MTVNRGSREKELSTSHKDTADDEDGDNNNNDDDDEDYHAIVRHLRAKRLSRELAEAEVQRELLRRKSAQRGQQMSAVLTVAEQRAKQKVLIKFIACTTK